MKWYAVLRHWTWELPQTLLGLLLICLYRTKLKVITYKNQRIYIYDQFPGGISLGHFVLVDYDRQIMYCINGENNTTFCKYYRMKLGDSIKHESGHGVQSAWLGPLYLLTVGLVSAGWNIARKMSSKLEKKDYFSIWPENQADRLGGVQR